MAQQFNFFRGQFADSTGCEIAEPERAFGDSAQPEDSESHITAHAANLSVESLMERKGEGGIAMGRGAGRDLDRSRFVSLGEHHAAPHDIKSFFRGFSSDKHFIGLSPAAARVHKLLGEGAVVGQDEESLGKIIQAADGVEAQPAKLLRNKIKDGFASLGIGGSGDHLHGLVQHKIDMLLSVPERLAVHSDSVAGADAHAGFGRGAIDADTSLGDEFVSLAAGADAGLGNNFIETESFFHVIAASISPWWTMKQTPSRRQREMNPLFGIFKVYIITIMGHLNIPLLSLLYRQKTDLPQDSMTPLSPFPMWNFLFFHMKDAFFFLLGCRRCLRTSSRIAYTSHLEGWPSLQKFFSASAHPALVRFSSSLLSFSWRNSVLGYNPTKV